MNRSHIHRLKPAVARETLLIVAGVIWSGVGVMLTTWAVISLSAASPVETAVFGVAGLAGGVAAWRFGFGHLAAKNIARLEQAPIRACVFGFQAWKSYLIMASMIALGITLRHSSIPKPWLAIVYATVGVGLFLASLSYYRHFRRLLHESRAQEAAASEVPGEG